jgi:adenylate cyclase
MIADRVSAPVRLIKMIGDAGMLVCDDSDALLNAAFDLVDAAAERGEDFPDLKAGLARGEALHKWGDWYGSPVNVASRVTSIARPGSVLVTRGVRDAVNGDYQWSAVGERKLKGVGQPVRLYRARRWQD